MHKPNFYFNTKQKYLQLLLLFILPFICNAQVKVLYNARIFTADLQHPYAEAIAINGKKIIAVGKNAEVKKIAGAAELRFTMVKEKGINNVFNQCFTRES